MYMSDRQGNRFQGFKYRLSKTQNFQAQRETVFPFQNPRQRIDAVKNSSSDSREVHKPEISI